MALKISSLLDPFRSVLTLIPSVALLIVMVPRLHSVIGKGRLEGLRASFLYRIKTAVVLGALAIQIALLVKFLGLQSYTGSSILSTVLYIVSLVSCAMDQFLRILIVILSQPYNTFTRSINIDIVSIVAWCNRSSPLRVLQHVQPFHHVTSVLVGYSSDLHLPDSNLDPRVTQRLERPYPPSQTSLCHLHYVDFHSRKHSQGQPQVPSSPRSHSSRAD